MRDSVQLFLDKAKQERKSKILIAAGLYETQTRFNDEYTDEFNEIDDTTGKYYCKKLVPIDVTDEELEEIAKYVDIAKDEPHAKIVSKGAELVLKIFSLIILVSGVIFAFTIGDVMGFVYFVSSLMCAALLSVLANISITLKEINARI